MEEGKKSPKHRLHLPGTWANLILFSIISATDRRARPRIMEPFMGKLLCLESRTWRQLPVAKQANKINFLPAVAQCDATINYLQTHSESIEAACVLRAEAGTFS